MSSSKVAGGVGQMHRRKEASHSSVWHAGPGPAAMLKGIARAVFNFLYHSHFFFHLCLPILTVDTLNICYIQELLWKVGILISHIPS